ncbi:MAG TPA: HAD hydrolase-like protein [Pyrinomonadaceae bacterium]|nr:HAD hydrolase-like protein [Pyrinomonadaceae bacterium]
MKNDEWKVVPESQIVNESSMRVLLWDLDGTLVRGKRYGVFKDYTIPMLERVFGTAGSLGDMMVSGMTDLQIVEEALRGKGITREHIVARRDELLRCYIEEMKRATGNGAHTIHAMPGGREVLQKVADHPRFRSALLTGNIQPAAYLKLVLTGLSEFFQLPGAFGDESFDRRDLPAIAAQRINEHLGANLQPEQFIVIGDTPNDIACARHFGARVLAVATGRMHSKEDLLAHEPDALLPDLLDAELVMGTLESL